MANKGKESGKTVKTDEMKSEAIGGAKGKQEKIVTLAVVKQAMALASKNHPNLKNMTEQAMATYTKQELTKQDYDVSIKGNKLVSGNNEFPINSTAKGTWNVTQEEKKDKKKK